MNEVLLSSSLNPVYRPKKRTVPINLTLVKMSQSHLPLYPKGTYFYTSGWVTIPESSVIASSILRPETIVTHWYDKGRNSLK